MNSIFLYTNPNIIANLIQVELNAIINFLAPSKIIQATKNYIPYYNDEIKSKIEVKKILLSKAIVSKCADDWREFRNFRN